MRTLLIDDLRNLPADRIARMQLVIDKIYRQEFDELKMVTHSLRHDCGKTKSANEAIKIIAENTGLEEERVKEIMIKIGKHK